MGYQPSGQTLMFGAWQSCVFVKCQDIGGKRKQVHDGLVMVTSIHVYQGFKELQLQQITKAVLPFADGQLAERQLRHVT